MTTPTPHHPPTYSAPPQHFDQPQQPAPKKRHTALIVVAAAAAAVVMLAVVIGAMLAAGGSDPAAQPKPLTAWQQEQQGAGPTGEDLPDPAPTTAGPTLAASDVKLAVKVTDKQCFGSAGCNVEFKLNAGWGPTLSEDETWLVTYEVTGVEDGPLIGSFEITGDTYTVPEEFAQTARKSSKIKVKVTDVEKVGI